MVPATVVPLRGATAERRLSQRSPVALRLAVPVRLRAEDGQRLAHGLTSHAVFAYSTQPNLASSTRCARQGPTSNPPGYATSRLRQLACTSYRTVTPPAECHRKKQFVATATSREGSKNKLQIDHLQP